MDIDLSSEADVNFKPTLYDIHKILDENIVGEFSCRMSLFTLWILGETNVLMSGSRSSGKTFITDHVRELVGDIEDKKDEQGRSYVLTAGSEKSAWYQLEQIRKADFIVVLELNKIPKEAREILKDWGEGKSSKYKTVTFGKKFGQTIRQTMNIELPRKPFVFCLADEQEEKVNAQLLSRLITLRTDSSTYQNKAVIEQQARLAIEPTNFKKVDLKLLNKIKHHILTLPPLNKYEFKHPACDHFLNYIPTYYSDCRREFPNYLANTYGITRFYWKERMTYSKDGHNFMFVTPQDMYLNNEIFGPIFLESSLKCNALERKMLEIIQREKRPCSSKKMQIEMTRINGINISLAMTTKHLNNMSDMGYVNKLRQRGFGDVYEAGQFLHSFRMSIDWKKILDSTSKVMRKFYPEVAEEYIEKYCKKPLVIHPFTGKTIDLSKIEYSKQNEIRDKLGGFIK